MNEQKQKVTWRNVNVITTLLKQSPRLQMFGWLPVVSIQVFSVEVYIVRCTWVIERKIFTQNTFLVHAQTILEVNDVFVQFHFLSSYRKHSSKRLCIATTSFRSVQFGLRNTVAQPRWYPECTDWPETVKAENFSWISLCTDVPPPSEKIGRREESLSPPDFFWGRGR